MNVLLNGRCGARHRGIAIALAMAALLLAGCKQKSGTVLDQRVSLGSEARMGDPRYSTQLLKGFHGIEAGAWRWTARQFSVILRPPAGTPEKGATLEFQFTILESVIAKQGEITLSAAIGDQALPAATFRKAGKQVYSADVPAASLGAEAVKIDFSLDKAIPPNPPEMRELGVVAGSVALRAKPAK
jgi:hypothetical protein